MSRQVSLDLQQSALAVCRAETARLVPEERLVTTVDGLKIGLPSHSKAAEVAGVNRYEFIHELTRLGVSPVQDLACARRKDVFSIALAGGVVLFKTDRSKEARADLNKIGKIAE